VNIYLACTVRGDRGAVAGLRALVSALDAAGHIVVTAHLLDDNVDHEESSLTEAQVYERDIAWLDACDVLIADASGSSFGVGFEVGYVLGRAGGTTQRVLLLYAAARRGVISRLIVGNSHPRCEVVPYSSDTDLVAGVLSRLEARGASGGI
jgi:hypothetical protein